MPDPNFHHRLATPLSAEELARHTGASLSKGADPKRGLEDVAPLDAAGPKDLTFFDNIKYKAQFEKTKAGACLVRPEFVEIAPKGVVLLVTDKPYIAYARAARMFYPLETPAPRIAESAFIHSTAKLGEGCVIEEGVVIGEGARLGAGCRVEPNAVIGRNVIMGDHCRIGACASVDYAILGNHVWLYPGVRVGQDGFGFASEAAGAPVKIPQLGRVLIGDGVEIGANTCIDRGSGPDTVIGRGAWIDNLVQVGHNVRIGEFCVIAAQTGISGSSVIEDRVFIGGQVGISGHLKIGKGARLAAQSGITRNIPAGGVYMGYPALPMRQFLKGIAHLNRLIKNEKSS